jgi:AraC-like DNA-binding protein
MSDAPPTAGGFFAAPDSLLLPPSRHGYRRRLSIGPWSAVYYDRHPPNEWAEHSHPFIQVSLLLTPVVYVLKRRTTDGLLHVSEMKGPCVWTIPADMPHALVAPVEAEMVTIFLCPEFAGEITGKSEVDFHLGRLAHVCCRDFFIAETTRVFSRLCGSEAPQPERYVASLGGTLGAHVLRAVQGFTGGPGLLARDVVERVLCYIDAHLLEGDLGLETLARLAGMGRTRFTEQFKATLGVTVGEYITLRRTYHAQGLLRSSDKKGVDVALESGFSQQSVMVRTFKTLLGCTPEEYRKAATPIGSLPLGAVLGGSLFSEPAGVQASAVDRELRLLAAAKLVELRRVNVVTGAQLAGMAVWDFVEAISRLGVKVPDGTPPGRN